MIQAQRTSFSPPFRNWSYTLWDLLQEMQRATMEYMLENLPHPPRRKRLTKKRLGLN
jgi:hypothetical protein